MFKRILLATDGSQLSARGEKQAIKLGKALRIPITAVHVVESYHQRLTDEEDGFAIPVISVFKKDFEERAAARAKKILDPVKEAANKVGVRCNAIAVAGDYPFEAIIKQARKSKCDLIVMASHGRSGIRSVLLGSETAKVLTHSRIPVLVVR